MEGVGDEVEDKLSPVIEMLRQYLMNISESGSDWNLVDQGNRALFGLKQVLHNNSEIMPVTQLSLYNSLVIPVISYGCEIWGFCEAHPLEKLHISFLKSILGVRKTTPTCTLYKELNVTNLQCLRLKRIVKFWLKVIKLSDSDPVCL